MNSASQNDVPSPSPVRFERTAQIAVLAMALVFAYLAWERRWFNDDCFITFRYAQNVAEGHGFVWNTTEPSVPVEGSSSLAWTGLNAIAIALKLHPTPVSHAAGLLAGIAGLALVFRAARRHVRLDPLWALAAPALLVAHRQYVYWTVSAMETIAGVVAAFLATILVVAEVSEGKRRFPVSGLVFFAATLIRPEAPLFHLAAGLGAFAIEPSIERMRRVIASGAVHGALLGALTLVRLAYFGKPLPNTFYAKVGGLQIDRGLEYVTHFLTQYHAAFWGPLLIAGIVVMLRRRDTMLAAIAMQIALGLAWFIASGGGQWEFRYFTWLLPGWAVFVASSLSGFARGFAAESKPRAFRVGLVALAGVLLVGTQASTLTTPFRIWRDMMSFEELDAAAKAMLTDGRKLAEVLDREDRIAIGWAGAVPYLTRAWHFDPWGLNEADSHTWPFDPDGAIYHQRAATWEQIKQADVMAVDIFNQFLYRRPEPPQRLVAKLQPWVKEGILVYCVEIPDERAPWYFVFASPRPVDEVEAWIAAKGLRRVYAVPLQTGERTPRIGAPALSAD